MVAAGLIGILVHNLADSLFTHVPYVNRSLLASSCPGSDGACDDERDTDPTRTPALLAPKWPRLRKDWRPDTRNRDRYLQSCS